jgi:hypothetical protein
MKSGLLFPSVTACASYLNLCESNKAPSWFCREYPIDLRAGFERTGRIHRPREDNLSRGSRARQPRLASRATSVRNSPIERPYGSFGMFDVASTSANSWKQWSSSVSWSSAARKTSGIRTWCATNSPSSNKDLRNCFLISSGGKSSALQKTTSAHFLIVTTVAIEVVKLDVVHNRILSA